MNRFRERICWPLYMEIVVDLQSVGQISTNLIAVQITNISYNLVVSSTDLSGTQLQDNCHHSKHSLI